MKVGTNELIIILIVAMIVFGPTQIPRLTKMFGKSLKSFRDAMKDEDENGDDGDDDDDDNAESKPEKEAQKTE